jgi:hypothetical protein
MIEKKTIADHIKVLIENEKQFQSYNNHKKKLAKKSSSLSSSSKYKLIKNSDEKKTLIDDAFYVKRHSRPPAQASSSATSLSIKKARIKSIEVKAARSKPSDILWYLIDLIYEIKLALEQHEQQKTQRQVYLSQKFYEFRDLLFLFVFFLTNILIIFCVFLRV